MLGDRLDILVANAGIFKTASLEEATIEDFDDLFAVNVRAPYFLVQQLRHVMCKGSNLNLLSSLAAHASVGKLPAYGGEIEYTELKEKSWSATPLPEPGQ